MSASAAQFLETITQAAMSVLQAAHIALVTP